MVGLAVARALALTGHEPLLLEANPLLGSETSSRNSEVIHGGMYYPTSSVRAHLCVRGRHLLYDFAARAGVPHRRIGKLIIATDHQELAALERLAIQAEANGMTGRDQLRWLSAAEVRGIEPEVVGVFALHSPATGIIDSHALMLALQGEAEAAGATVVTRARVNAARTLGGHILEVESPDGRLMLRSPLVVNAAGLGAAALAAKWEGLASSLVPAMQLLKGSYFTLSGRSPFNHLIYPAPNTGWLGLHATIDLGGQCRFGPDMEPVERLDYSVDPNRAPAFYQAVRRWWPNLADEALSPGYAGVRPRVRRQRASDVDFHIQAPEQHRLPGLVNLFGIESPGLTSAMAIAEEVVSLLNQQT